MKSKILSACALLLLSSLVCLQGFSAVNPPAKKVNIVLAKTHHSRVTYGAGRLAAALQKAGYSVATTNAVSAAATNIVVSVKQTDPAQQSNPKAPGKEGFTLSGGGKSFKIVGNDNSGALYGCLELAERITDAHKLPANISFSDKPEMVMRGTCIGMQKTTYLPGRGTYEYPYTPELFPWFYDKAFWGRYLDSLAQNRMNSLYLWSGHPFASLVKVKDYPYALEVDEATFKKNEEIYNWLAKECDKRGIWLVQGFYNIIVSKPFAEHNHLKTQDRNRHIVPIIADYTRKSIAAFVEKYPNVGLLITLGEAMEGEGQDDIDWFTKTIIPGVKDGLKALGRTDEPPIVLRGHDTNAPEDMKYAKPLYSNLYTEAKYNGEALTTYEPHGPWADLHRTLSRIGTVQIENVHIMANLEPFRYGSPDFIQKCVQAMHSVYEANGLHLYPQASYWDWPYSADNLAGGKRLYQIDRDWIWYRTWSRYAWNAHRNRADEIKYWSEELGNKYGADNAHAREILEAYEQSGNISPEILRRFGITDGNRQTMALGMLMAQLVNPEKFGLFTLLYNSEGPVGEMLSEYALKEWKHESHEGETPMDVINKVKAQGKAAVAAIDKATPGVTRDKAEFDRLKNDMYCYDAMGECYAHKAQAALYILRYKYSNDIADLEKAVPEMEQSLQYFRKLTDLTKDTYLYANSMQTQQRKIPVGGNNGKMKTWVELLPVYERELDNFRKNIAQLKAGGKKEEKIVLTNTQVNVQGNLPTYTLTEGANMFTDTTATLKAIAPELKGLQGIKLDRAKQMADGTTITFTNNKPVKVLVGYFIRKGQTKFLSEPQLETDGTANDYGQADSKITSGVQIEGMPPVNVHTFSFKAGTNTLTLGKGAALVLGFVDDSANVPVYDAGLSNEGNIKDLRWLFN